MTTPIGRTGLTRTVSGAQASGFPVAAPSNVVFFDDFLGDILLDKWNYTEGTDASPTNAAVLAGGIGGVCRLSAGDAGTGLAADLACLSQELQWQASNGGLKAEARVKLSALADAYFFFGFTDVATLEASVVSAASGNTLTTTASDAVGFMFDTRMTTDNFWLVGVKGDVDATAQDSLVAPVAAAYITLRLEVTALGAANFYINGAMVGTTMLNAVTPGADLTPTIQFGNTANTVPKTCDVDYAGFAMDRGVNGTAN